MADRAARIENFWAGRATGGAAAHSTREDAHRRRSLRIAIRQLERAELYLVALYSLDLTEERIEGAVDDLLRDLRGLRHHLVRSKLTA